MARKKPIHKRHVPHFIAVVVIVTALVSLVAVSGNLYQMSQQIEEVASARTSVQSKGKSNQTKNKGNTQKNKKPLPCKSRNNQRCISPKPSKIPRPCPTAGKGCITPKPSAIIISDPECAFTTTGCRTTQ